MALGFEGWNVQIEAEKRKDGWRSILEAAVWVKGKFYDTFREDMLS